MTGDANAMPTAVVTGASRGIGFEVSRALVGLGYRVAMLARSEVELRARATDLGDAKRAIALPCDVTDAESVARVAQLATVQLGGTPNVLVNNAGVFRLATLVRTDPAEFREAIDTNLVAPFLLVRAFLPAMLARASGHIVTIGSVADRSIFPENASYASSKFGLRALHEVMRAELRGSGVRATLVSPAAVDTSMWDAVDPDARPGFTPRRDMLRAAAVADAVRYVVSVPADVNVDELRLSHQ